MGHRLKWTDGREFDLVSALTFEEQATVERQAKCGWSTLGEALTGMAFCLITLRRNGIILQWDDMLTMAVGVDLDIIADDEDAGEPAVPTIPGPGAGEIASLPVETGTG